MKQTKSGTAAAGGRDENHVVALIEEINTLGKAIWQNCKQLRLELDKYQQCSLALFICEIQVASKLAEWTRCEIWPVDDMLKRALEFAQSSIQSASTSWGAEVLRASLRHPWVENKLDREISILRFALQNAKEWTEIELEWFLVKAWNRVSVLLLLLFLLL